MSIEYTQNIICDGPSCMGDTESIVAGVPQHWYSLHHEGQYHFSNVTCLLEFIEIHSAEHDATPAATPDQPATPVQ